jgi:hypothetical protein
MNVDVAGVVYEGDSGLKKLYAVANAPIFSYDDGFFGQEIVGGPMHSVSAGSRETAAVAVRILGGEKAGDIKTPPSGYAAPKFDWRQLQRWGIAESRLPAGSRVYFREPSILERYRWQIALVFAVLLLQAGLISILLYERRRRKIAEFEARQRIAELAHVNRYTVAGELNPGQHRNRRADAGVARARRWRAEGDPVRHQARRPSRRRGDPALAQPAQARAVRREGDRPQ